MKNLRTISKNSTRSRILESTLKIIITKGIVDTSTKSIADSCNVAHGTLFAHFENRENLIGQVLKNELLQIAKRIYQLDIPNASLEDILSEYLNLIIEKEGLYVIINKEFPFVGTDIKREIITTESNIKNLVLRKIKKGIRDKSYKAISPTMTVSFFFGTLNYYLSRKEYFVENGSVIEQKKDEIITTFLSLLKHNHGQ